jgi:hypothetical protein
MFRNVTDGDISGGVSFANDSFPSEYRYYNDFDILGNGSTTYNRDPYIPIENEPMGYGYAAKNFESSLDGVSPYRYQPNPRYEEVYYPAAMLGPDPMTKSQYERLANSPDSSTAANSQTNTVQGIATATYTPWWQPSYGELVILVILLFIVLMVVGWTGHAEVSRLKEKVRDLKQTQRVVEAINPAA